MINELKKRTSEWELYSTDIPANSFDCLRKALSKTLYLYCKRLNHIPGQFVIEPISFKGPPVLIQYPHFPTCYRVKFFSTQANEDSPEWEFDVDVNMFFEKCVGPNKDFIAEEGAKIYDRLPPPEEATK